MIVSQLWIDNSLRNFNYLLVCPSSGAAIAIDPLDHKRCLQQAKDAGWEITHILNTHEHNDHTAGNEPVRAATGAKLLAHHGAGKSIMGVDQGLHAGDEIRVGTDLKLRVLDTPGHTKSHVCIVADGEQPALFCGDTLFNAGAGNCHNGGDASLLYHTFMEQIERLAANTRIYPGHDYLTNNLAFTLDREPSNETAANLLQQLEVAHDPNNPRITTLAEERDINTFLRLHNPEIIAGLQERFPQLGANPDPQQVFIKLRELRNHW